MSGMYMSPLTPPNRIPAPQQGICDLSLFTFNLSSVGNNKQNNGVNGSNH